MGWGVVEKTGGGNNNSLIGWEVEALSLPTPTRFSSGLVPSTFPWDEKEDLNYHKQAQRERAFRFRSWINLDFFPEVEYTDMQEICFIEKSL